MQKKQIAFFGITGILIVSTFIKVPCPVCDGTGSVATSSHMDQLFFSNLQTELKFLNPDFCIGYTMYEYEINITLTNDASEDADGWISLLLKATSTGKVLDTQYMGVDVPGKTTTVDTFTVYFKTQYDQTQDVFIEPSVNLGQVECLTCGGRGRLPLNVWFVAVGIKSSLAQITKSQTSFEPPPVVIFPPGE
jgi:hypothetical protein